MMPAAAVSSITGQDSAALRANSSLAALGVAGRTGKMSADQIDRAARDFESLFMAQMLESMFGESAGEDAFGSEDTNEVYKGLMMQEYGKIIAASGGIGIASHVRDTLLKLQESGS